MNLNGSLDYLPQIIPALDATPKVFIVDSDVSARTNLESIFREEGWNPQTFASAAEFLDSQPQHSPSCLLLDVSFTGFNGLEVQRRLAVKRPELPIIFLSSKCNMELTVQAIKAGAHEFLVKPVAPHTLVSVTGQAIEMSRLHLRRKKNLQSVCDAYVSLSAREREVMTLVVAGMLNKQVAGQLGISEVTVKAHRARVMHKMKADSLADLVRLAALIQPVDVI